MPFKGPAMYEELIRIPLIVSAPGRVEPAVCDALVNQIDLLPTLCDLAGVPSPAGVDGRSLRPLLERKRGPAAGERDHVVIEYFGKQRWRVPIRAIRTRSFKYVRYRRYGEELYDLRHDPHERVNLAGHPDHAAQREALADKLDRWLSRTRDPFATLSVTDRKGEIIADDR